MKNIKDPCTRKETFKIISYAVFMGLFDSDLYGETWEAVKTLVYAILIIVLRGLLLVLFPITLPALYVFARYMQKGVIERRTQKPPLRNPKPRFECKDVDGIRYEIDNGEQE